MFLGREIIGVEIGTEFLKLIHTRKSTRLSLTGWWLPTARQARGIKVLNVYTQDIRGLPDEKIAEAIKNYLAEYKISAGTVLALVGPAYTINKNIEVPSTDPKEISGIIQLQASRYTPYSKDEIIIDHYPIAVKEGHSKIHLVIVKRDIIKRFQTILEQAGLNLKKVLLGSEATGQWYRDRFGTEPGPVCLLNFDSHTTDFIALTGNKPVFVRSIPVGAYQIREGIGGAKEKLINELRNSLESYRAENTESISKIIVLGATEGLKVATASREGNDLAALLEEQLKLPVRSESYLDHFSFKPPTETRDISLLPLLAMPLYYQLEGLINLTPEEVRLRQSRLRQRQDLAFVGITLLLIFVISSILFAQKLSLKQEEVNFLEERYNSTRAKSEELSRMRKRTMKVNQHLANRSRSIDRLSGLYDLVPDNIVLEMVSMEEEKVVEREHRGNQIKLKGCLEIEGYSEMDKDIQGFIDAMENSPFFKMVTMASRSNKNITKEGRQITVSGFRLIAPFEEIVPEKPK